MSILRRVGWFRAMTAACVLLLCASAQAQVLDQVPEDAQVVIKFKNLQAINTKLIALAQRLGLAQLDPGFQDPLGKLVEESGFKDGLDKNGEMAFVISKIPFVPNAGEGPSEPLVLVLVPITDYHALLGNFVGNKKDGDLDVVRIQDAPEDVFVADWGKYAAFSPSKEAIVKGNPLKFSTAIRKEMDAKDASVFFNVKAVAAIVLPIIQQHKPEILEQIAAEMKNAPNGNENMTPVAQAVVTQILAGAEHFLNECTGAVLSGNLSDDGTNFAVMADFTPDSYLGKLVQAVHNVESSFTAGLPEGKYIVYGGGTVNGTQGVQVIDDIVGPIIAELTKASPEKAKVVNDYLQGLRSAMSNTQSQTFGLLAPSGQLGQGSLFQVLAITTGDADKITDGQKAALASTGEFVKMLTGAAGTPFQMSVTVTPDAKTISGVSFTQFQTKVEGGENDPAAMQIQQAFAMMYGPGGPSQLFGKVDDKHVLAGVCVDDATIGLAVAAIKGNADPLGKLAEVQVVNKNLPQKRAAAVYLSVDVLVSTVMDYVAKFGMPVPPLQLKPNLPPVGFTCGSEESAYRADCFVPTELLENLVAASMQMWMGARGGMGLGGGGM